MSKKHNDNKRRLFCFSCLDQNVGELFLSILKEEHPDLNEWFLYEELNQKELKYFFALKFAERKRISSMTDKFAKFKMIDEQYPSKSKMHELKKENRLEIHSLEEILSLESKMRKQKEENDELKKENGQLKKKNSQLQTEIQIKDKELQELQKKLPESIPELALREQTIIEDWPIVLQVPTEEWMVNDISPASRPSQGKEQSHLGEIVRAYSYRDFREPFPEINGNIMQLMEGARENFSFISPNRFRHSPVLQRESLKSIGGLKRP